MTLVERGVAEPTVSLAAMLAGNAEIAGRTEVRLADYVEEILRSGLPGVRATESARGVRSRLDGYLDRIFDHELAENGFVVRRPAALRQWLSAYAAASSTSTSYEKIRDAATGGQSDKPTKVTTAGYRDELMRLWVLDPLEPWLPGNQHLSRLAGSPKHHLADPALAARLLNLTAPQLIGPRQLDDPQPRDGTMLGQLFESLVTLDVRVLAQSAEARTTHLRTRGGEHEVDLIVTGPDGRVVAAEVKVTAAPTDGDVKHLQWLRRELGDRLADAMIITTGPYAYRRPDGVAVVPAALLGA